MPLFVYIGYNLGNLPEFIGKWIMIIDSDLVVKVGDGIAVFEEPTLRDWAILVDMEKKTLEQQADLLIPKLKELRGFQYKDGTDVSVEDIKNKKFSAKFFLQLMTAWSRAVVDGIRGDSEEKKEQPIVN
jgi:hypothetical protein